MKSVRQHRRPYDTQPDISLFLAKDALNRPKDALSRPTCPQAFGFIDSSYAGRFEDVWAELAGLLGTWAQRITVTAKDRQKMLKRCDSCWTRVGFPKDCLMTNVVRVPLQPVCCPFLLPTEI